MFGSFGSCCFLLMKRDHPETVCKNSLLSTYNVICKSRSPSTVHGPCLEGPCSKPALADHARHLHNHSQSQINYNAKAKPTNHEHTRIIPKANNCRIGFGSPNNTSLGIHTGFAKVRIGNAENQNLVPCVQEPSKKQHTLGRIKKAPECAPEM